MTSHSAPVPPRPSCAAVGAVVAAAVPATLTAWWLWLGRDRAYQVDPATGVATGPYESWQVAGCALTLVVVVALAARIARPWLVALAVTGTFTAAWAWDAASRDETGLWGVGAVLVLLGTGAGSTVVAHVSRLARRRR